MPLMMVRGTQEAALVLLLVCMAGSMAVTAARAMTGSQEEFHAHPGHDLHPRSVEYMRDVLEGRREPMQRLRDGWTANMDVDDVLSAFSGKSSRFAKARAEQAAASSDISRDRREADTCVSKSPSRCVGVNAPICANQTHLDCLDDLFWHCSGQDAEYSGDFTLPGVEVCQYDNDDFYQGRLVQHTVDSAHVARGTLAANGYECAARDVFVYTPPNYDAASDDLPVVIFLHGYARPPPPPPSPRTRALLMPPALSELLRFPISIFSLAFVLE